MRGFLALLGSFGILGFLFSFELEASFSARAKPMQVVRKHPERLKLGGAGYETVGPAAMMVLDDKAALLPGYGASGQLLVDEAALKQGGYPIALESVQSMAWMARIGCMLTTLASLCGYVMLPRIRARDLD